MEMHKLTTLNAEEILAQPSGLYSGVNSDGQQVMISRQKNHGFIIMNPTHNGWYECNEYNESGELVGTTYEK